MISANIVNHSDPKICQQCRGRCCQGHPGLWVDPARFISVFPCPSFPFSQNFQKAFDPLGTSFRDIDGVLIPTPQTIETGCIFLRPEGCAVAETKRPCQCLALMPNIDTLLCDDIHCYLPQQSSTHNAMTKWRRFWRDTGYAI